MALGSQDISFCVIIADHSIRDAARHSESLQSEMLSRQIDALAQTRRWLVVAPPGNPGVRADRHWLGRLFYLRKQGIASHGQG